jgi:Tfp pilus assembly protein PilF
MMRWRWTNIWLCAALAAGAIGGAATARAADDTARFNGTWQATIPYNGQTITVVSVHDGSTFKNYVIGPNGNVPVGGGTISAVDGKWIITSPQGNDSGTYEFTDDNTAVCKDVTGATVVWKRAGGPQVAAPRPGDIPPKERAVIEGKIQAGDFEGAWREMLTIKGRAHDPVRLSLDAAVRLGLGQFDVARQEAAIVLQLPGHLDDADALRIYAQATAAMGYLHEAKQALDIYSTLRPKDAAVLGKSVNDYATRQPVGCAPDQIIPQLDQLVKMAGDGTDVEALVHQATIVLKGENDVRLTEYDFYRNRKRELTLAAAADPKNAQKLLVLAQFMLEESAQIHGNCGYGYRPFFSFRCANPPDEQEQVIALCNQAMQLDNTNSKAHTVKAGALIELGQDDDARREIDVAMQMNSSDPELLRMFGQLLNEAAASNTAAADQLATPTMTEDDQYVYIHQRSEADLSQARSYYALADQQQQMALNAIQTAINNSRGTADGFYFASVLAHRDGDNRASAADLEKAVAFDPDNCYYHMLLGKRYSELGPSTLAQSWQQDSAGDNLRQTSANKLIVLAWHQLRLRDYQGAQQTLEQAKKIDPTDPHVLACMGLLIAGEYRDKSQEDQAAALLLAAWSLEQAYLRLNGSGISTAASNFDPMDVGLEVGLAAAAGERLLNVHRPQQAYGMLKIVLGDCDHVIGQKINNPVQTAALPLPAVQDPIVPGPRGLENVRKPPILPFSFWLRSCHKLAASALGEMGQFAAAAQENAQAASIKDPAFDPNQPLSPGVFGRRR